MADRIYITKIQVEKVRHLQNVEIPLGDAGQGMQHLILTGGNGSGKTSLLEAIAGSLEKEGDAAQGLQLTFNVPESEMRSAFAEGEFILAAFDAHRHFEAEEPDMIRKIRLKKSYAIKERPEKEVLKYMLGLTVAQAFAMQTHKTEKADEIQSWFDQLQQILRDLYGDDSLHLEFDFDTYGFLIHTKGREPFDLNTASDGFSALLEIIMGLVMRMQEQGRYATAYDRPGIVLVDEVECHLQFIVTTTSPFVLGSLKGAVICDLDQMI